MSSSTGLAFELWVALRYLRSTRKDAFISLLSRITAAGLAVGVAALIVALAALSGFQSRLMGDMQRRTPALQVELPPAADEAAIGRLVQAEPGVHSVQQLLYGRGWLRRGDAIEPVEVVGVEGALPRWVVPEPGRPEEGSGIDGLWISTAVAARWGVIPGDVVELVSPRLTLSPRGPVPRSRRVAVAGLHDPGQSDERHAQRALLPYELARNLIEGSDRRLGVEPGRSVAVERLASRLRERLGSVAPGGTATSDVGAPRVVTWRDANQALLFVLRLEKSAIFLAVALIVVVASFALVSALSLILTAKRSEVGILAAMGAAPGRLRRVFVLLGAMLAGLGTVAGGVLGVALALLFERFRLFKLPGDVYIVDHVPFLVRVSDVAVVLGASAIVALVATLAGSRTVGTLDPVEALRR
ncbi:MAG TPA: FtsX-like permease family protein [Thermoanaerobaculia bacterium]|nr:FtsX-like permease family protein [Thermoanaerobaculia bacterium]